MTETIVVTGAAGFLGSHLVEALLARGVRVVGIDNFDPFYARAVKDGNVRLCAAAAERHRATFRLAPIDIAESRAVAALFAEAKPDGVIHLAAKAGVRPSIADPAGYARANVTGTSVVLQEAARAGCGRIVLASSSSVYGNNTKAPFAETDDVSGPISPYAATKRACELVAHAHWALTRMPTACLRFFTVFGPRQRPDLAIARFLARVSRAEPIEMYGDGTTRRDYTYVDDITAGLLAAYDRVPSHGYRIWNLGSDRPVLLRDVIASVGRVVGREPVVEARPQQPGDVEQTWADLGRARAELGYTPRTPFEEGLRRQWEWMRQTAGAHG